MQLWRQPLVAQLWWQHAHAALCQHHLPTLTLFQPPRSPQPAGAAPAHSSSLAAAQAPPFEDAALPRVPEEPAPDECCGRGCAECVWTRYWEELKEHNEAVAARTGQEAPLDHFEAMERRLEAQRQQQQGQQEQQQQRRRRPPND